MDALSDEEVARLLPILSERARASQATSESFRPPQTGIVEQVASNWHHFVVGRRGVGKSMLLLRIQEHSRENGLPVAYIDVETLRDNPYPDVLIRLLIDLVAELETNLKRDLSELTTWNGRRVARKRLREFRRRLTRLLADPQEALHRLNDQTKQRRGRHARAAANATVPLADLGELGVGGSLEGGTTREHTATRDAEFTRTKLEVLRAEAIEFRSVLDGAVKAGGKGAAVVILDDFYFIGRENQPDVLSYLQQVFKNLNIWLKVGAVEHRLNEFEDGDPPRGLQMNQDAAKVPMDTTLADFDHTKRFLEDILRDVCTGAGVKLDQLVTDTARTRLVMASGGVPRDYINLVMSCLQRSTRRTDTHALPRNKVTAEDVSLSAPDFLKQKEDDLKVDARPEDVDRLRAQFNQVLNFCLLLRRTNVFLVESRFLREDQWGRDIAALSDLRLFHRIGNVTVKSSEPQYVGKRYDAFALDLSSYAGQRVRTTEVEFWTTDGHQQLRGATKVFSPEVFAAVEEAFAKEQAKAKRAEPAKDPDQIDLWEAISSAEADEAADSTDDGRTEV